MAKKNTNVFTIVHISDLHRKVEKDVFYAHTTIPTITDIERLEQDGIIQHPDVIVVSGDLVQEGESQKQYKSTIKVLEDLSKKLFEKEHKDRLVIIPGNHDVDFAVCGSAIRSYNEETCEPEPHTYENGKKYGFISSIYLNKNGNFADCLEHLTGKTWAKQFAQQVLVYEVKQPDKTPGIVFLGLNSAFRVIEGNDEAGIDDDALGRALDIARKYDTDKWIKVLVHHHGYESTKKGKKDYIEATNMQTLFDQEIDMVLHGHSHKLTALKEVIFKEHSGVPSLGAGTLSGDPEKGAIGLNYHIISINFSERNCDVFPRMRGGIKEPWRVDNRLLERGKDRFELKLPERKFKAPRPKRDGEIDGPSPKKGEAKVKTSPVETPKKNKEEKKDEEKVSGFAIRCPYCLNWTEWEHQHPSQFVVDENRFDQINERFPLKSHHDLPGRLLICQRPHWECPAPFEALIFSNEEIASRCLAKVKNNWAVKRDFRLFKFDKKNRWNNSEEGEYFVILFCTMPVRRQRNIELEHLLDREILSRLMSGFRSEIKAPVTIYSSTIIKEEPYWMPIEGDTLDSTSIPRGFKDLCKEVRKIVESETLKRISARKYPRNCTKFGDLGGETCAGKKAECLDAMPNWNRCPLYISERKDVCPCYGSDITQLVEKKLTKELEIKSDYKEWSLNSCDFGFEDRAFPIVVHEHYIGAVITGQAITQPLKSIPEIVKKWGILAGHEKRLEDAKNKTEKKSKPISEKVRNRNINKLRDFSLKLKEIAETRYFDIRTRSEIAFEDEILSYIREIPTEQKDINFFKEPLFYILDRMRQFWAFKTVAFLHHNALSKEVNLIGLCCDNQADNKKTGFDDGGLFLGMVEDEYQQTYPLPWLYDMQNIERPINEWTKEFVGHLLKLIEDGVLPDGRCYFMVCVPVGDEDMCAFLFATRDPSLVSKTKSLNKGYVSQVAQEYILRTCCELTATLQVGHFFDNIIDS